MPRSSTPAAIVGRPADTAIPNIARPLESAAPYVSDLDARDMIEVRYPSGFTVEEWEDLGYVLVTLVAVETSTQIVFMSRDRLVDELDGELAATEDWEERNCVVVKPFTKASVDAFLERARPTGFARFW